jgi:hydroxyacylglutathione hydrolase
VIVRTLSVGELATHCHIVASETTLEAIVIDPGGDADRILAELRRLNLRVVQIVDTHGHFDHTLANGRVKEATGAPLSIHQADAEMLTNPLKGFSFWAGNLKPGPAADGFLKDGDVLRAGEVSLKVLHTPGHSPGSISLCTDGAVFSGDALFQGSIGRTDFPGGDYETLIRSIRTRLLTLPDETVVYTGHGPNTTVGAERLDNPFLGG